MIYAKYGKVIHNLYGEATGNYSPMKKSLKNENGRS